MAAVSSDTAPCVTGNLGPRGAGKRRNFGVGMLAVVIGVEVAFVSANASPWWRLAMLPLVYSAISGLLQAREKT